MKHLLQLFIVLFVACQPKAKPNSTETSNYKELQKVHWLKGTWQRQSAKGILTETWQQLDESTFAGRSFFVSNGDTVSSETISLEQRNGKLYYIPIVSGQNDGKAIVFTQTKLSDSTIIFENPAHDFPQKIEYRFQKPDSLIAEVSSVSGELKKSIVFRMRRVN
ncbi:MAG: hypothetical protein JNK09_04645 [Prolixibacteraceae bacterium]|nr:hypothetical protein [Prolixibacteraceae bacterium]